VRIVSLHLDAVNGKVLSEAAICYQNPLRRYTRGDRRKRRLKFLLKVGTLEYPQRAAISFTERATSVRRRAALSRRISQSWALKVRPVCALKRCSNPEGLNPTRLAISATFRRRLHSRCISLTASRTLSSIDPSALSGRARGAGLLCRRPRARLRCTLSSG